MDKIKRDELRKAASCIDPKEWYLAYEFDGDESGVYPDPVATDEVFAVEDSEPVDICHTHSDVLVSSFIAAADPKTIIELLDYVDEIENENQQLKDFYNGGP